MNLPKLPALPNFASDLQRFLPKRSDGSSNSVYSVIDIGGSMVRVAVIELTDDGVAILGRGSAKQQPTTMYGGLVGNLPALIETIDEA